MRVVPYGEFAHLALTGFWINGLETRALYSARVWYACEGTISFGGASEVSQITFAVSLDAKREVVAQLLSQRGYQPMTWDRQVALPRTKTKQWLNWIGEPSPGSEYKWCIEESIYRQVRQSIDSTS